MARNVFYSFDFDDIMAANVVRNSNVVRAVNAQLPFKDKSIYDAAKNTPGAIKRAIDDALCGSSVTVVLNGTLTASSAWVRYEIAKSFERGNGFLVIDINGIGPANSWPGTSLLTGYSPPAAGPNVLASLLTGYSPPAAGPNVLASLLTGPSAPAAGPNPLSKMGGTCAAGSDRINVYELNGNQWVQFAMLKELSNATAKYPRTIIDGEFNLQQRFSRHMHWRNAQMYFSSVIEAAAKEAGWPPLT